MNAKQSEGERREQRWKERESCRSRKLKMLTVINAVCFQGWYRLFSFTSRIRRIKWRKYPQKSGILRSPTRIHLSTSSTRSNREAWSVSIYSRRTVPIMALTMFCSLFCLCRTSVHNGCARLDCEFLAVNPQKFFQSTYSSKFSVLRCQRMQLVCL